MNKLRIIKVCLCLVATAGLAACSSESTADNTEEPASSTQPPDTSTAEYEDTKLELKDASKTTLEDGTEALLVNATFTNNSSKGIYAMSAFAVNAFQNDTQIEDISDINGDQVSLTTEVKDGASIDVQYCFKLSDDSPVEVDICEPTADQDKLGGKTYTLN